MVNEQYLKPILNIGERLGVDLVCLDISHAKLIPLYFAAKILRFSGYNEEIRAELDNKLSSFDSECFKHLSVFEDLSPFDAIKKLEEVKDDLIKAVCFSVISSLDLLPQKEDNIWYREAKKFYDDSIETNKYHYENMASSAERKHYFIGQSDTVGELEELIKKSEIQGCNIIYLRNLPKDGKKCYDEFNEFLKKKGIKIYCLKELNRPIPSESNIKEVKSGAILRIDYKNVVFVHSDYTGKALEELDVDLLVGNTKEENVRSIAPFMNYRFVEEKAGKVGVVDNTIVRYLNKNQIASL